MYGQKVGAPEAKCTKKHSFRLTGSRCDVLLAAETNEQRQKWMSALQFAATGYKVSLDFSKITQFLDRILMEHIELICSLECELALLSLCPIRTFSRNRDFNPFVRRFDKIPFTS